MPSDMSRFARPSANVPPPPEREPTRLEILKTKKGRPFAGEHTDLDEEFKLSSGVINYTGHLPGLHSPIGRSYPNLAKQSAMFLEDKGKPGWGGPRVPINDDTHDKWGSMKPLPAQLKKDIANMYLQASHPSMPIDTSVGVGYSPSRRTDPPTEVTQKYFAHTVNNGNDGASPQRNSMTLSQSMTPSRMGSSYGAGNDSLSASANGTNKHRRISGSEVYNVSPSRAGTSMAPTTSEGPLVPSMRVPVEKPAHIAGYKGYMPGTRHMYGENWNRVDHRARVNASVNGTGGKGITASVMAASPVRMYGEYESQNLVMANRNAIPH